MNLYLRLLWNWLRARAKPAITMANGITKGAVVGREGIVSSSETLAALGVNPVSPVFPATVATWIEADRLIRA